MTLEKSCPICGITKIYSNKYTLKVAIDNNSLCNKCAEQTRNQSSIWKHLDVNLIKQMYIDKKLSILTISKNLNVSYKIIRKVLLNNDVHLRNRNTDGLRILSEETKQKIKLANSGKNGYWYGKPMLPKTLAAINRNRVKKHTPETIQKMSLTRISKGLSKGKNNPMSREDVILKWIKSNKIGPNKKELALFNILENIFPNKYKLNVKGEVLILGGKIPDFVDLNTRVIIELYGDYWHKGENENERINFFKNLGYNTLIIWEKELNFPEILKEKIKKFTQL